ncbi:MAG: helix-turn-helix transcriptional regulator [Opitutaceae bacterium]|nr:helix-turn-helix transcriptional regulator [Opitutaceae bacterium]
MADEGRTELRSLGNAIRAERAKLGVSQEDFAEICDLHRTYIGQLERGEKNVSFTNVLRVARAFRLKPSALLSRAGL